MLKYLQSFYNPSVEDVQRIVPTYTPFTREQLIIQYNNDRPATGISCQEDAIFALKKLDKLTTRYKLSPEQRVELGKLTEKIDSVDWTEFCNVLEPHQIEYIGW